MTRNGMCARFFLNYYGAELKCFGPEKPFSCLAPKYVKLGENRAKMRIICLACNLADITKLT